MSVSPSSTSQATDTSYLYQTFASLGLARSTGDISSTEQTFDQLLQNTQSTQQTTTSQTTASQTAQNLLVSTPVQLLTVSSATQATADVTLAQQTSLKDFGEMNKTSMEGQALPSTKNLIIATDAVGAYIQLRNDDGTLITTLPPFSDKVQDILSNFGFGAEMQTQFDSLFSQIQTAGYNVPLQLDGFQYTSPVEGTVSFNMFRTDGAQYGYTPTVDEFMAATGADRTTANQLLGNLPYGGRDYDIRDWKSIMASSDPLTAARQATRAMWNDTAYQKWVTTEQQKYTDSMTRLNAMNAIKPGSATSGADVGYYGVTPFTSA